MSFQFDILDIDTNEQKPIFNPRPYQKLANFTFKSSFIIGTILLVAYLIFMYEEQFIISAFIVLFIIGINFLVFLFLLWKIIQQSAYRKVLFKSTAKLFINIPITIIYFFIAIFWQDYFFRLQIINDREEVITNFIFSVEGDTILSADILLPNQSLGTHLQNKKRDYSFNNLQYKFNDSTINLSNIWIGTWDIQTLLLSDLSTSIREPEFLEVVPAEVSIIEEND